MNTIANEFVAEVIESGYLHNVADEMLFRSQIILASDIDAAEANRVRSEVQNSLELLQQKVTEEVARIHEGRNL